MELWNILWPILTTSILLTIAVLVLYFFVVKVHFKELAHEARKYLSMLVIGLWIGALFAFVINATVMLPRTKLDRSGVDSDQHSWETAHATYTPTETK